MPPATAPDPFSVHVGSGGGFQITTAQGASYEVQSRISWPHGEFNHLNTAEEAADDPEVSIEGIEFMDFPEEMRLLKAQATAIHRRHPGFKVVFHIAHSLYCTDEPDRFPDSKIILANGEQAVWGASEPYISQRRQDEGWTWWIYYPTPGNSCHDAMLNSRKMNSVLLLSQPSLIEYARKIRDKGGVVIGNSAVFTRSICNEKYIIYDSECASGPALHTAPSVTALAAPPFATEKEIYLDMLALDGPVDLVIKPATE